MAPIAIVGIQYNIDSMCRIMFNAPIIFNGRPRLTAQRLAYNTIRINLWRNRTLMYQHMIPSYWFDRRYLKPIMRL